MKTCCTLLITLLLILGTSLQTLATEEWAEKTGKECRHCHLDPSGGGELTAVGEGYLLSLQTPDAAVSAQTETKSANRLTHLFRFAVGYIHILIGFFWFGTILYVHLILKPAYASKGLPKGEVKLGLLSIVVMAITGTILTLYRVPSFEFFFASRFGLLLFIKIVLFFLMGSSAFFVVFFIGPRLKKKMAEPTLTGGTMTEEELSFFNGEEGRQAYFAYQGKVYDATKSKLWKNGTHMARHNAGFDLTGVLPQAPHGETQVLSLPVVATLVAETTRPSGFNHKKVFIFMAYMNLINVFLIILILTLWKWW
jgi:predicted heme/steroid binding protein/uncharacterized membrane protein